MKKGLLITISGPSGAGKGVIYNSIIERMPNIKKSISVTTRAPRAHEQEGVHYYYKTIEEYQEMIARGEFLETAAVYNNYYGTPKKPVFDMLEKGYDVMFEVDVIGAKQIKNKYPECVMIFVMTPDFTTLEARLRGRNSETEDSITTRLNSAARELAEYTYYDYIIFNDDIDKAIDEATAIITAEKRRVTRNEAHIISILESKKLR
ncbi:guanylate kinase-related [Holotrichia oblita]|nr:guanylate kinase-related [Holotrichia oblita]